jgi:hypothetical protein
MKLGFGKMERMVCCLCGALTAQARSTPGEGKAFLGSAKKETAGEARP